MTASSLKLCPSRIAQRAGAMDEGISLWFGKSECSHVASRGSLCSSCILPSACQRANSSGRCCFWFCLRLLPRSVGSGSWVAAAMQTATARRRARTKESRRGRKAILLFDGESKRAQLMEHCCPAKPTVLQPLGEISLSFLFLEMGTTDGHSSV